MKPEYLLLGFTMCEVCSQWYAEAVRLEELWQFKEDEDSPKVSKFQETLFERYGLGKLYKLLVERISKPQPPLRRYEMMSKLKFLKNRIEVLVNITSYMATDEKLTVLPSLSILVHMLRPELKNVNFKAKGLIRKRKFTEEKANKINTLYTKINDVLSQLESDIEKSKQKAYGSKDTT